MSLLLNVAWRVFRLTAKSFLLVLVLIGAGCMAIPAGKSWKPHEGTKKIEGAKTAIETTLRLENDTRGGQLICRPMLRSQVVVDEVQEYHADIQRKLVLGFFPGAGQMKYSNFAKPHDTKLFVEGPANTFQAAGQGMFYLIFGLILTPVSWFTEPFYSWNYNEREFSPVDRAIFGYAKTSDSISTDKEKTIATDFKEVTELVFGLSLALSIPAINYRLSASSGSDGAALFDYTEYAVLATGTTFSVTIDAPEAEPRPILATTTLAANAVGSEFRKKLFARNVDLPRIIDTDIEGCDLDWEKVSAAPRGASEISILPSRKTPAEAVALSVVVANHGRAALCQLIGRTKSPDTNFDGRLLLFGRVEPGTAVARTFEVPINQEMKSGDYRVEVEFIEGNNYAPEPISGLVAVKALPRPALAFTYRIVDDPDQGAKIVGNADGVIDRGEAFDLVLTVKNTGDAMAQDTRVDIDSPAAGTINIFDESRAVIGALAPGETKSCRFNIGLPATAPLDAIPVEVRVKEDSFAAATEQSISLPFNRAIARKPIAVDAMYYIAADDTVRREGASDSAPEFGRLGKGVALHGVGELEDWVQVELDVREGDQAQASRLWVRKNALSATAPAAAAPAVAKEIKVTRFEAPPPAILFVQPESETISTSEDRLQLVVSVTDSKGKLADARLFAGDQEVGEGDRGMKVIGNLVEAGASGGRVLLRPRASAGSPKH